MGCFSTRLVTIGANLCDTLPKHHETSQVPPLQACIRLRPNLAVFIVIGIAKTVALGRIPNLVLTLYLTITASPTPRPTPDPDTFCYYQPSLYSTTPSRLRTAVAGA